jgi:hypothetical protein
MAYAGLYFCRKPFYVAKKTLMDDMGLDAAAIGEIGTAYLVAYAIGQFMSAGLGQRRGARIVLLTGMAVSIGCNVAFAFANNYWTLFVFMTINGLAQATGWPAADRRPGRRGPPDQRDGWRAVDVDPTPAHQPRSDRRLLLRRQVRPVRALELGSLPLGDELRLGRRQGGLPVDALRPRGVRGSDLRRGGVGQGVLGAARTAVVS